MSILKRNITDNFVSVGVPSPCPHGLLRYLSYDVLKVSCLWGERRIYKTEI